MSLTDRQACALRYIAHERVIRCQDCAHYCEIEESIHDPWGFDDDEPGEWCELTNLLVNASGFCSDAVLGEEA